MTRIKQPRSGFTIVINGNVSAELTEDVAWRRFMDSQASDRILSYYGIVIASFHADTPMKPS
jgi:hypothetical protein